MKNILPSPFTSLPGAATKILLGFFLAAGTTTLVHAQAEIASGTISGNGAGPYVYSLTFSDGAGAGSPIGSIWYAWVPGLFFFYPALPPAFRPQPAGPPALLIVEVNLPFNMWPVRQLLTSRPVNRFRGLDMMLRFRPRSWRQPPIPANLSLIRPGSFLTVETPSPFRPYQSHPRTRCFCRA